MKNRLKELIVFAGYPGSGKGLFSHYLVRNYGIHYFGMGDEMRKYSTEQSDFGKYVASFIENGDLVPDDLINKIFHRGVVEKESQRSIIDGFPRTLKQELALRDLKKIPGTRIIIFYLKCSRETSIFRTSQRLICSACGIAYHSVLNRPKRKGYCDEDNNLLEARSDIGTSKERLKNFDEKTLPMIERMRELEKIYDFYELDSELEKEEIFKEMERVLGLSSNVD